MKVPPPVPIPKPSAPPPGLAADVVASGLPVHPEDRVKLFSPDEWERFVQDVACATAPFDKLVVVTERVDPLGRDVIATVKGGNGAWVRRTEARGARSELGDRRGDGHLRSRQAPLPRREARETPFGVRVPDEGIGSPACEVARPEA